MHTRSKEAEENTDDLATGQAVPHSGNYSLTGSKKPTQLKN